jgi:hypothetical protein
MAEKTTTLRSLNNIDLTNLELDKDLKDEAKIQFENAYVTNEMENNAPGPQPTVYEPTPVVDESPRFIPGPGMK